MFAPSASVPEVSGSASTSSESTTDASSATSSSVSTTDASKTTGSSRPKTERRFQESWKSQFPWLIFDKEKASMFCSVCQSAGIARNSFTEGCSNLRKSAIEDHILTADHKRALDVPHQQQNKEKCQKVILTQQEKGMAAAVRAVHWIIQEDLALSKYPSVMQLLKESGAAHVEHLSVSKGTHYDTRHTAYEILECLAEEVDQHAREELSASPFVAVMADETTDITVKKRLGLYVRTISPDMEPKTRFITNLSVPDGSGKTIADAISTVLLEYGVPPEKIIALGSDGASVMTGNKKGVTGLMHRQSPHMVNIHCIAHRLALCTSQAADSVPAMKEYQECLTSLFYYFKASAVRTSALTAIQDLLDEPNLRMKEVYSVRWLSFYQALETIFRSLDTLLTYFTDDNRQQDAKAIGLRRKVRILRIRY